VLGPAGLVAIFWQGAGLHDVFAFAQSGYFYLTLASADIDSLLNRGRHPVDDVDHPSLIADCLGFGRVRLERTAASRRLLWRSVSA